MKHDKRVKKQNIPKGFHLYIEGPGRVDDSKSIDLSEEVTPDMMIDGQPAYTIFACKGMEQPKQLYGKLKIVKQKST